MKLRAHRHSRHAKGMVLIEVMTALVIFTVAAFALVMALDSSFDAAMERNQIEVALRGLNNQVALLHAARVVPGDQDLPDDGTGILYHLSVSQQQMQDQKHQPVANMYSATITAKWTFRNQPQERDITELIYQP